ncbi:N-acetylmuramoyl-L-alanine amidase [Diplocloster hominis]|uniref:N-acetylmuramoyl-L-alanine amidase n=1 Tax=Diplocloster hominis TaxID=3079010 RepID=UPI0031BB928A
MKRKTLEIGMGVLMLAGVLFLSRQGAVLVSNMKQAQAQQKVVVIDAGHGGADPGKVGVSGTLEKDINLKIAFQLKEFLEENDIKVVMTRDSDGGLYDSSASNKKVQDMQRRCSVIDSAKPVCTVSIHQNSYHEEGVHGAQAFYYSHSAEGKELAEMIQASLIGTVDPENHREAKANDSYYLLKRTETPVVIVECGFLSNWVESAKLEDEYYQEKLAWAVHMAVMQYIAAN